MEHPRHCGCCPSPPTPSLFEMAALRKQYRAELAQAALASAEMPGRVGNVPVSSHGISSHDPLSTSDASATATTTATCTIATTTTTATTATVTTPITTINPTTAKSGVLPVVLQSIFDHAKSLERGRSGRSLSNFRAPRLLDAVAEYEKGFALVIEMVPALELTPGVVRVLDKYRANLHALRFPPAPPAVAPFDELLRAPGTFRFDTSRHHLATLVAAFAYVRVAGVDDGDNGEVTVNSDVDGETDCDGDSMASGGCCFSKAGTDSKGGASDDTGGSIDTNSVGVASSSVVDNSEYTGGVDDLGLSLANAQFHQLTCTERDSAGEDDVSNDTLRDGNEESASADNDDRKLSLALAQLHKRPCAERDCPPPECPALLQGMFAAGMKMPKGWRVLGARKKEHIRIFRHTENYEAFIAAYTRFIDEVIVPLVGERVAYQCPPTLRFQFPSRRASCAPHVDRSYPGHQADSEINFWVPLTKVGGANSLWLESAPGKRDFAPLDLDYGAFHRFDGMHCEHYTVANTTNFTRASLDFRVVPISNWRNEFGGRIGTYPMHLSSQHGIPS